MTISFRNNTTISDFLAILKKFSASLLTISLANYSNSSRISAADLSEIPRGNATATPLAILLPIFFYLLFLQ